MRVNEALLARDDAVYRMENVCASNRAKDATITRLRQEKENLEVQLAFERASTDTVKNNSNEIKTQNEPNAEIVAKLESMSLSLDVARSAAMASIRWAEHITVGLRRNCMVLTSVSVVTGSSIRSAQSGSRNAQARICQCTIYPLLLICRHIWTTGKCRGPEGDNGCALCNTCSTTCT